MLYEMMYPNNQKELITIFDNKDIKIIMYATHNDDENGSGKT